MSDQLLSGLQHWLKAHAKPINQVFRCRCGFEGDAMFFTEADTRFADSFICGTCLQDADRAELVHFVDDSWTPESELANGIRAERNRRLETSAWAVLPGSPLTEKCQAEWTAYRAWLNAISVSFKCPSAVEWRDEPSKEFTPAAEAIP